MRRSRFTLIELLVVITIIAILMAILLPAVMAAYRETQKTKARAQMVYVKNAVQMYLDTYQTMPSGTGGLSTTGAAAPIATTLVTDYLVAGVANNPRGIPFFANANVAKQLTMPWTLGAPTQTNGMRAVWNTATNKIIVYASCPWSGSTFVSDGSTSLNAEPTTP
jgi:prepilin-type N-terminal cleavage/methylation domain-containing protein